MRNLSVSFLAGACALVSSLAQADTVRLHKDDVIPVVMQTELSFKTTREGDLFKAEATDSQMVPLGSRLEGVVKRVEQKRGDRPAFMDIEFTTIILPDGHRTQLHGTPIALSKDYVTRDRYGRWEAKKGVKKEVVVLGGLAGGLVLGSMVGKPFEGTMIGALAGIIAAETDKEHVADGDVVVPKGSKVGARIDEELTVDFDGRWDANGPASGDYGPYDREGYNKEGYDRYGYDRNGRYDSRYDSVHAGRDDNRDFNDHGFDRYGYDRDGHYNPRYDSTRDAREHGRDGYDRPQPRNGDLQIEIDRKALRYQADEQPFRRGWIIMVPLRSTAEQMGYTASKEGSGYRIENDDNVLTVEQDSRTYRLNRRRGTLPTEVEVRDGIAFIPIDAFTTMVKGSVYVNGTRYRPES